MMIAPEGSFVVSPVNVTAVWFSIFVMFFSLSFSFSVSRFFPFPKNFRKRQLLWQFFFVVFVAAAGGCLVEEKEWYDLLGKEDIVFCVYTLNPFMSWLILQNDSQFPGLGKADSVLCKIGHRKPTYHCCVCRN